MFHVDILMTPGVRRETTFELNWVFKQQKHGKSNKMGKLYV